MSASSCAVAQSNAQRFLFDLREVLGQQAHKNTASAVRTAIRICTDGLVAIIDDLSIKNAELVDKSSQHVDSSALIAFIDTQKKFNEDIIARMDTLSPPQTTFADVLKKIPPPKTKEVAKKTTKHVVIVRQNGVQNSVNNECNELNFKSVLKKNKSTAAIKKIIKRPDKLVIECSTSGDVQQVIDAVGADTESAFSALQVKQRNPRVFIHRVGTEVTTDEIINELVVKNKSLKKFFDDNPSKDIADHICVKFAFKARNSTGQVIDNNRQNIILEVSPEVRRLIKQSVFVGYESCRVSEHIQVTRCYKCCAFQHIASNCTAGHQVCGHCGGNHAVNRGDVCIEPKKCVNCDNHNKRVANESKKFSTDHSVYDKCCKSYQQVRKNLSERVIHG